LSSDLVDSVSGLVDLSSDLVDDSASDAPLGEAESLTPLGDSVVDVPLGEAELFIPLGDCVSDAPLGGDTLSVPCVPLGASTPLVPLVASFGCVSPEFPPLAQAPVNKASPNTSEKAVNFRFTIKPPKVLKIFCTESGLLPP
jgi:hypothetical protein